MSSSSIHHALLTNNDLVISHSIGVPLESVIGQSGNNASRLDVLEATVAGLTGGSAVIDDVSAPNAMSVRSSLKSNAETAAQIAALPAAATIDDVAVPSITKVWSSSKTSTQISTSVSTAVAALEASLAQGVTASMTFAPVTVIASASVNIAAAPATIDGIGMLIGDPVYLGGQGGNLSTPSANNGFYTYQGLGLPLTRSPNLDFVSPDYAVGVTVYAQGGAEAGRVWRVVSAGLARGDPILITTPTSMTFVGDWQAGGAASLPSHGTQFTDDVAYTSLPANILAAGLGISNPPLANQLQGTGWRQNTVGNRATTSSRLSYAQGVLDVSPPRLFNNSATPLTLSVYAAAHVQSDGGNRTYNFFLWLRTAAGNCVLQANTLRSGVTVGSNAILQVAVTVTLATGDSVFTDLHSTGAFYVTGGTLRCMEV